MQRRKHKSLKRRVKPLSLHPWHSEQHRFGSRLLAQAQSAAENPDALEGEQVQYDAAWQPARVPGQGKVGAG